jgi:hypothetical protein
VLKVSDTDAWPICVPFLDKATTMRAWAGAETDVNRLVVVLVGSSERSARSGCRDY